MAKSELVSSGVAKSQTLEPETQPVTRSALMQVNFQLNGQPWSLDVEARRTLLDALRHDCGLSGAKKVCDMGNCGACTVQLDGRAVYSCLVLAVECEGQDITTIEGVAADGELSSLQLAFIEHDAFQCGYCTPGQLMSLKALFDSNPHPDERAISEAVAGNLCRCGAYRHILRAAQAVADEQGGGGQQ